MKSLYVSALIAGMGFYLVMFFATDIWVSALSRVAPGPNFQKSIAIQKQIAFIRKQKGWNYTATNTYIFHHKSLHVSDPKRNVTFLGNDGTTEVIKVSCDGTIKIRNLTFVMDSDTINNLGFCYQ